MCKTVIPSAKMRAIRSPAVACCRPRRAGGKTEPMRLRAVALLCKGALPFARLNRRGGLEIA